MVLYVYYLTPDYLFLFSIIKGSNGLHKIDAFYANLGGLKKINLSATLGDTEFYFVLIEFKWCYMSII